MKVNVNGKTYTATLYTFPRKGNAPAGYYLLVDGVAVDAAMTGGGKYPRYTYFKHNGKSYYLPKDVVLLAGAEVTTDAPRAVLEYARPAPAPEVTAPTPAKLKRKSPKVTRAAK
jgi:hypothetical protein